MGATAAETASVPTAAVHEAFRRTLETRPVLSSGRSRTPGTKQELAATREGGRVGGAVPYLQEAVDLGLASEG